jgi:hypothetical protein
MSEAAVPARAPAPPDLPPQVQTNLTDLISVIAEKADPLINLLSSSMESYQKGRDREYRFQARMAWAAIVVVSVIVAVAGFLTDRGRIDGSTFTFLLGLIVGYVLTFVRDQIKGPGE